MNHCHVHLIGERSLHCQYILSFHAKFFTHFDYTGSGKYSRPYFFAFEGFGIDKCAECLGSRRKEDAVSQTSCQFGRLIFVFYYVKFIVIRQRNFRSFVTDILDTGFPACTESRLRDNCGIRMAGVYNQFDILIMNNTDHIRLRETPDLYINSGMFGQNFAILAYDRHKDPLSFIRVLQIFPISKFGAKFSSVLSSGNNPNQSLYPLGVIILPSAT